jgi:uncharacterized protein YdhG (YjbR/CyaY superfamily)
MDTANQEAKTIDEYIGRFPEDIQQRLEALRQTIKQAAPDAQEAISYGMPAFRMGKILVYFAAAKKHIGFYPTGSGMAAFKDKIGDYPSSKGTIQFPNDRPMPLDLVTKIVRFRAAEVSKK